MIITAGSWVFHCILHFKQSESHQNSTCWYYIWQCVSAVFIWRSLKIIIIKRNRTRCCSDVIVILLFIVSVLARFSEILRR